MAAGSRRRSLLDAGLGLGGFSLLYWAFASPARCQLKQERDGLHQQTRDIVDIASEESFPASDSPAW